MMETWLKQERLVARTLQDFQIEGGKAEYLEYLPRNSGGKKERSLWKARDRSRLILAL